MSVKVQNPYAWKRVGRTISCPNQVKLRPAFEQAKRLAEDLTDLRLNPTGVDQLARGQILPGEAEGFGVLPKPSLVAERLGLDDLFTVEGGYLTILDPLQARGFKIADSKLEMLRKSELQVRQSVVEALCRLEEMQPGDFLVVPVQTGVRYLGHSILDARWDMGQGGVEYPMPAGFAMSILHGNPGRFPSAPRRGIELQRERTVNIYCGGDELQLTSDDTDFPGSLCIGFCRSFWQVEHAWLNKVDASEVRGDHGCASFFMPKVR